MTPIQLRITNFGPFRGTQVFEFPTKPGLYFLWGRNDEEPQLEANGAGKSKLWDALTWVLYGKTGKGLRAGDICSWDVEGGTKVEFIYEDRNGFTCYVQRTWSPNSWTYWQEHAHHPDDPAGKPMDLAAKDAHNPLLAELRLEFTPFLHSILMAQGLPMFLDLKPDAKAALFAEVMQLDSWLERAKRAGEKAADQDRQSRQLETRVANLQGRIAAWKDDDEVHEKSERWKAETAKRLDVLGAEHDRLVADHRACKVDAVHWRDQLESLRTAVEKTLPPLHEAEDLLREWQSNYEAVKRETIKAEQASEEADRILATLKSQEYCPTCDQKIDRLHIARHKALADEAHVKYRLLQVAEEDNAQAVDKYQERVRTAIQRREEALDDLRQAERMLQQKQTELGRIDRDLDAVEDEAERLQEAANPFADMEARQQEEQRRLGAELRRAEFELDESQGTHWLWTNWVRWFKEIRLQLIGEALQQLEIEVNSCVTELGLVNWELHFDIDKETKSGGLQRGFAVTVMSPHNEKPVPWDAWSGGEGQRLRIAGTMGQADLIRARSGTGLNLEVWDEPTQWLSPQGVQDLLESLRARAEREQRQIWIVDHRTLGFAGFSGQVGVVKTAEGSRFVYPQEKR